MTKTNIVMLTKVLVFWLLFAVLMNIIGAFTPFSPNWLHGASFGACVTIAMLGVTYFLLKYEKLALMSLDMSFKKSSVLKFTLSLVAGVAFFGIFYLLYLWLTPVIIASTQANSIIKTILLAVLSLTMLSAMEELAFRGYALKQLENVMGTRAAIYLTSLAFGLYHGFSLDSITGPAVWGLLYAVLAFWSKGLAVPIGFHAGANIIQALCGEKPRYADSIWAFDLAEEITPFTVEQVSLWLKIFLFVLAVLLVEIYLSRSKKSAPYRIKTA